MLLTQTVRLKLNNAEKNILTNLCYLSKNLFNVGLETVRQDFFTEQKYLSYESNYYLCKENKNYQLLATDCGQQTLKYVDRCFKAFFKLLSVRKEEMYREKINFPQYLPKDGFFPLIIPIRARHNFAQNNWKFKITTSRQYAGECGSVLEHLASIETCCLFTMPRIPLIPNFWVGESNVGCITPNLVI